MADSDVIVIGCGASGIAAMQKLHEAGIRVLGLEAAHRIGGRVDTVPYADGVVDLGAAWCESSKNNIVYDLVHSYDLLEAEGPNNDTFILSDGEQIPTEKGKGILKELGDAVVNGDDNVTKSAAECVRNALNTNAVLQKDKELSKLFVRWYEKSNQLGEDTDLRKTKSLNQIRGRWMLDGPMFNWKGKGYRMILDVMMKKYPNPAKELPLQILLKKEVETITWEEASTDEVEVRCKDGSVYTAKSVITTIPVGVLKERHNQLFNPPLPFEKLTIINSMEVFVLAKIYIEFENPWWPKNPSNFVILWKDQDKYKFSEDEDWIPSIYALETVAHQPNVLLAWTSGSGAEKMARVSEEGVKAGVEKLLDLVFKQFDVAAVKSIFRTKWGVNRFARGAYSYPSVASEALGNNAAVLGEPIYRDSFPVLCFAGEATSPKNYISVHGAIEAGYREADRLIKKFNQI